ncbi:hypothetical protein Tco_1310443 [Tanacetum coccineum]
MAEENIPAPVTYKDENERRLYHALRVNNREKSTFYSNAQKIHENPIFQISVYILSNTNFFRAFTASVNVPAIYLQQFWNTMKYDEKTGVYRCQIDEQCFDLRKTSGSDKPKERNTPSSANAMGIVTQSNVIMHELLWGKQLIKKQPSLRRPDSAVHHTGDNFLLGNLKFVPKGETVEVFGMAIPDPLITEAIQQSLYYPKYLEMVAENTKKTPQESAIVQLQQSMLHQKATTSTPDKQPSQLCPTKKPSKHKLSYTKIRKGNPTFPTVDEDDGSSTSIYSSRRSYQALCLDPAILPQVAHSLIDLSKKKRTTDQFILVRRDQTPHDSTTGPSSQPEDDTSEKVIHESSSTSDSERTESEKETAAPKGDKDQGEVDSSTVTSGASIPVSVPEKAHEALAGPDPEPMQEDQTGSNSGKLHVSLAGPNPEHMDDEFLATAYPKVHENLKLITDERVIEENPESHSGSMSSMKNLDDTYNFGDQFLYDKPTEDDQEKSKVIKESDSTIPDPSHQTVTSTPPVIAPFTNVSSTKPSSLVTPPPINTEATTITTSLPEITPFIALQLRVARLEQEMSEVKKTDHSADVLASIKSQVPMVVDEYLGTKLDDSLLKILERHTADLIEKYSVLPGPDPSLLRTVTDWATGETSSKIYRIAEESIFHISVPYYKNTNFCFFQGIHCISKFPSSPFSSLTEVEEESWCKRIHATRCQELSSESELEPTSKKTVLFLSFRDSLMSLKESKKISKRQPGTGGSNEGTGNILGVPDESTVISRASSEGTGSKPGVPDEEKLIL